MKVAELLIEMVSDRMTDNLCAWLKDKFKSADNVIFEVQPIIDFVRKMHDIPAEQKNCVKMVVSGRGKKSAIAYLTQVLSERFPKDNILGIRPTLINLENGVIILLERAERFNEA